MGTTMDLLQNLEPRRLRIADIAKAAGFSQVTIYNYFGSKENLLSESFKNFVQQAIREFEEEMLRNHSMRDLIGYILVKEKETYSSLQPALIKEILYDNPQMYGYLQEQYDAKVIPLMLRMIEEGQARGEISDKVSVQAVLLQIQMYMKSSGEMLEAMEKHGDKMAFVDELLHLFFYGICGQEPANPK